ncbi:MAG: hypothetical protein M1510_03505 [Nitrospirae bacterium]|nr:hypothetical protein [Nitrospirota bacterium]
MSEKERSLPKPPSTPFGRKKHLEQDESREPLMVDKIAMAMAEGKLDEFMQKEMPESEHAKALTMMMMGMTGMMLPGSIPAASPENKETSSDEPGKDAAQGTASGVQPPEDIMMAVHSGDVQGLKGLLEREYKKLNPEAGQQSPDRASDQGGTPVGQSVPEKELVDQLLKIARDNKLDLDWIILRALRLYVQEYGKTGRL